ncbi:MAG TPA: DUF177 domain-containing protein [Xanthobacteraceae bacterium]|nr:DUF177 domain-containing protein [Xanthobacteraceae bacterium]
MTNPPVFSMPVPVASLPPEGRTYNIAPSDAEREALARALDIVALPALAADVTLVPDRAGGVAVTGRVSATVRQACVVSLEPFDAPVAEDIELHLVPEDKLPEPQPGEDIDVGAQELPDPLVDGVVDLGAVVAEFLALGIDPYPRRPGVQFVPPPAGGGPEAVSPFATLARLRGSDPADEE